jgi:DNA-binding PadR family transcriptional regulator
MVKPFTVSEEQKKQFAAAYLLKVIVNENVIIPLYLEEKDTDLEPVLEYMMMKRYLSVENQEFYAPTDKGKEILRRFMQRYSEFLKIFDIYCAVDLEEGVFAFEEYFKITDAQQWNKYINDERWEDLRVAVALYKKLNPVEIVFMSFLQEGQFGNRGEGWQFDLLLGSIWDDILEVCNTALTASDLAYEDEHGDLVDGNMVLEDVIIKGAEINLALHKEEQELHQEKQENDDFGDGYGVANIETEVYEYYCQPMYISPLWALILFI